MIKSVVFDLDGTLLNTLEDLCAACNYALSQYGYEEITTTDTRTFIGSGIRNLILQAAKMDETHVDEMFEHFREYYSIHYNDKTLPYPGIMELLLKLKKDGYRLGCVSNKAKYALGPLCDVHFSGIFEVVLGDLEGYNRKPDPEIILECAKRLDSSMEEFVYIGDSDTDVKTVKNSHCHGIFVSYGYRDREILAGLGAEVICDSAIDIYNKVKEL